MASNVIHIDPSSDEKISFREKIGSSYTDLSSDYENIVAFLYDQLDNEVEKWSRETQTGYETIFEPSSTQVDLYIARGLVADYIGQKMILEFKSIESVAGKGLEDDQEHLLTRIDLKVLKSNMGTTA